MGTDASFEVEKVVNSIYVWVYGHLHISTRGIVIG